MAMNIAVFVWKTLQLYIQQILGSILSSDVATLKEDYQSFPWPLQANDGMVGLIEIRPQ